MVGEEVGERQQEGQALLSHGLALPSEQEEGVPWAVDWGVDRWNQGHLG